MFNTKSKNVKFRNLSITPLVAGVRDELHKRAKKFIANNGFCEKLDLRSLTYTFCDEPRMRYIDIGLDRGCDAAGFFVIDFDRLQVIKMYGSCLLADGSVFEFVSYDDNHSKVLIFFNGESIGEIRTYFNYEVPMKWDVFLDGASIGTIETGSHLLFGKWIWLPKAILKNFLNMHTEYYGTLPVGIDKRSDNLFDFISLIIKLTTLYGLWKPSWLKNDDYILSENAMDDLPENFERLYFAINLCFRGVFFDNCFSGRAGP